MYGQRLRVLHLSRLIDQGQSSELRQRHLSLHYLALVGPCSLRTQVYFLESVISLGCEFCYRFFLLIQNELPKLSSFFRIILKQLVDHLLLIWSVGNIPWRHLLNRRLHLLALLYSSLMRFQLLSASLIVKPTI